MYSTFSASTASGDGDDEPARDATQDPAYRFALRSGPPENELGSRLDVGQVLARTGDAALRLTSVEVFSSGLAVDLELRVRTVEPHHTGHLALWDTWQQTLLGMELSDGTRAVSGRDLSWDAPPDAEPRYSLHPAGGSGGGRSFRQTFWLHPAPPPGDVLLVVACPALGSDEVVVTLPGGALAAAAAQVVELWPWEPEPQVEPGEVERPAVRPGGWFERALG